MQTLLQNSLKDAFADDWRNGGFGLYIHWPFCEAKCPYCDFNSHVAREIDQSRWKRAYLKEIAAAGRAYPDRVLNTVFFGGGTPSLMDPDVTASVIDAVKATWPVANDLEITLEANPSSVEAGRFRAYAEAGVNRISMGIQALNDPDLRRLGRVHTAQEAIQAFDIARENFARVSFDLIYARQGQSLSDWRKELSQALSMAVNHLSLYQLTIEPGTVFARRHANGKLRDLPDDELAGDMYDVTQEVCDAHGMSAYEVSNHAQNGAESRHNLIYWRYGDYVGIGPGAHGRVTENSARFATEAVSNPDRWLKMSEQGSPLKVKTELDRETQADEYLMMSLRLAEGLSISRHEALSGKVLSASALDYLNNINMIEIDGDRLRTTREGRLVLNAVIQELLNEQQA
ncbi:MAG: radical SAM family heme chaperone HemW [Pseudomonadota bacterium]